MDTEQQCGQTFFASDPSLMALGSVLLADGRLSSADTPSLAFADKVGADLLKLLHGVLDVRTIAIKLAAGKVVACPFSAEVIEAGRELVFSSLESAGSTLPVREVSEGQPFYLAAIEELLRMSGDPDYAAYDTAENSFAKGVRIGVGAELPRVPAVFEEKTGSRKYDDDAEHAQSERDNYLSARENAAEVQKQFLEEAALGAMVEVSLEEALAEYGDRLALASLGAIEKRDGTYRVVHDGTQGVGVNSSITVRDQLRSPTAGDLRTALRIMPRAFGLTGDVKRAHRLEVARQDWGLQACRTGVGGSDRVWLNKVGTFGVSSAS